MNVLIVTQKVDRNDPALGFFHRWIEEFARHSPRVTVICLERGACDLPTNVDVLSLGKEDKLGRLVYIVRFFRYITRTRARYDAVFVHMNPEYIVLGGLLWRLWRKKIALWYVHKSITLKLRMATVLAHLVFTASPESFRLRSDTVRIVGHGIDTDFFSADKTMAHGDYLLSVGRLDRSKRHDLAISAASLLGREVRIAGEGPERQHLERFARESGTRACFLGGLTQERLRDEYRKASFLIHASETGSLDKVVLEALAVDLPVITTSGAYGFLPVQKASPTPEAIARAIQEYVVRHTGAAVIREKHSLAKLIPAIIQALA